MKPVRTLNGRLSDATICRRNGWGLGTRLRGEEHYADGGSSTETITITAVGRESLLAVCDAHGGEMLWTLTHREWTRVGRRKALP